jgi:micrococcal nuclease
MSIRRRKRTPRRTDIWPRAWRRRPIAAVVAVLLLLVVVWGRVRVPVGSDHDRYHDRTFTCVNVVDGDTIDVDVPDGKYDHTRIRLWGVDTPETSKSDTGSMYFGPEASAFTKSLVLDRPVHLLLAPGRTRGKYGRLLAYVYVGDSDAMLNEELIRRGFAYADSRFKHPWKQRFLNLESKARRDGEGLWRDVTVGQMPEWRQRVEKRKTSRR